MHSNDLKDFNIYIFSKESFIEAESSEEIGGHFVLTYWHDSLFASFFKKSQILHEFYCLVILTPCCFNEKAHWVCGGCPDYSMVVLSVSR